MENTEKNVQEYCEADVKQTEELSKVIHGSNNIGAMSGLPNVDREAFGLSPIPEKMINTIIIPIDEYRELLTYKGKYEELKDICNNKLTSPILRPDAIPTHNHPWPAGVRSMNPTEEAPRHAHGIEGSNENHIPGV